MNTATNKPVRLLQVGVVGCGPIGAMHAQTACRHSAAELVAICAPTASRRDPLARQLGVAAYGSLDQMLTKSQLDCVLIASPDAMHTEHTTAALSAGVHVFCEKPLGFSVAEAESVCRLAKARGLHVGVNYNRRYSFGYQKAAQLLADRAIGDLRQLWLQVTDGTPPPHVATRADIMFWTLLGHHFDLLLFLAGDVRSVSAALRSSREDQLTDDLCVRCELMTGGLATLDVAYRDGQSRTTERCEIELRRWMPFVQHAWPKQLSPPIANKPTSSSRRSELCLTV